MRDCCLEWGDWQAERISNERTNVVMVKTRADWRILGVMTGLSGVGKRKDVEQDCIRLRTDWEGNCGGGIYGELKQGERLCRYGWCVYENVAVVGLSCVMIWLYWYVICSGRPYLTIVKWGETETEYLANLDVCRHLRSVSAECVVMLLVC